MRVVSLLPAATEILHALDAVSLLVGRSHECDQPADNSPAAQHLASLPELTRQRTVFTSAADVDRQVSTALADGLSLYDLDDERLQHLAPDLIITQDLCEVCSVDLAQVQRVAAGLSPTPAVLSLNPTTLEQVIDDVLRVGEAIGRSEAGRATVADLTQRLDGAAASVPDFADAQRVLFLEWTDPPFVPGHWTPQLIERAGGEHPLNPTSPVAAATNTPGPLAGERVAGKGFRVEPDQILAEDAHQPFDRVIVCPCGLSLDDTARETHRLIREGSWFTELHAVADDLQRSPASLADARIALVDGNRMFSRPSTALVDAALFLTAWLHERPKLIPAGFPASTLRADAAAPA